MPDRNPASAALDGVKADPLEQGRQRQLPLPVVGLDRSGDEVDGELSEAIEPRRPGRPKGARNRSTEEWRQFMLSRYPSPLIAMAETLSRPTDELATYLGCSRLKAYELQMQAAQALAPYMHQKQPIAVEGADGQALPIVAFVTPQTMEQFQESGEIIDLMPVHDEESEENQAFSALAGPVSDNGESDSEVQAVDNVDESGGGAGDD